MFLQHCDPYVFYLQAIYQLKFDSYHTNWRLFGKVYLTSSWHIYTCIHAAEVRIENLCRNISPIP